VPVRDVPQRRVVATGRRGPAVLGDASLNKGTAFTERERRELGLEGLLPDRIEDILDQLDRARDGYRQRPTDLDRHVFLRALQDANEVLFHRLLGADLTDLLPVVYTPTVGQACEEYSHIFRRPRGLFLSHAGRHRLDERLAAAPDGVEVLVVTDGERILGLGDQGVGGMGIAIGKLSLYVVAGGLDPRRTLPVLLDVGTNNAGLLADPLYLGARHERVTGQGYLDFVGDVVAAVARRYPGALLQWEDFAQHHATVLLDRHRREVPSFNDDIQGTAAVALAAVRGGLAAAGTPLAGARVVVAGAGSAGTGIAAMLVASGVGAAGIHVLDSQGLLHDRRGGAKPHQRPFVQPWDRVAGWADPTGPTDLATTVAAVRPHVLVGVSGRPGLFDEALVRGLAEAVARPVILALSNPTDRAEATPADLLAWTGGRALVATGSPFGDVVVGGRRHAVSQANNLHVFPGLGLGTLVAGAGRVSSAMLAAAAEAVAARARDRGPEAGLLPPLAEVAATSRRVAVAVAAAARDEGQGLEVDDDELGRRVAARWWEPDYPEIVAT